MHALADARLTEKDFLNLLASGSERCELVEGRVVAMAGGTRRHAAIARNLLVALGSKLAGAGCEAFHSDMALRTGPSSVRLPDVAIYCDSEELEQDAAQQRILTRPRVVIEVLSPSTAGADRAVKLLEYKALASVDTVVLVNAATRRIDVFERVSETEWRNVTLLPGAILSLRDPPIAMSPEEIFGTA